MAGGRHTNLGWCGWSWSALTERLEDLCAEIFRTSNGTTSAGLITRRLDERLACVPVTVWPPVVSDSPTFQ
jgi:hypothetical protein